MPVTVEEDESLNDRSVSVKLTSMVLPMKRRKVPTAAEKIEEWDLTDEERICRRAPTYTHSETRISITAKLAHPVFGDLTPLDGIWRIERKIDART